MPEPTADLHEPRWYAERWRAAKTMLEPDRLEPRATATAVGIGVAWRLAALFWTVIAA